MFKKIQILAIVFIIVSSSYQNYTNGNTFSNVAVNKEKAELVQSLDLCREHIMNIINDKNNKISLIDIDATKEKSVVLIEVLDKDYDYSELIDKLLGFFTTEKGLKASHYYFKRNVVDQNGGIEVEVKLLYNSELLQTYTKNISTFRK